MTGSGTLDDRELAEAFQFCVDWQLEVAADAVTAPTRVSPYAGVTLTTGPGMPGWHRPGPATTVIV